MRNGSIIEENSPKHFIEKYKQNLLEDIFFRICLESENIDNLKQENTNEKFRISSNLDSFNNDSERRESNLKNINPLNFLKQNLNSIQSKFDLSLRRLNANLYKDTIKCKRNTKLLIVQLLVPIIQITFFCLCIGRTPKNLHIGYINLDIDSSPDLGKYLELNNLI